MKLFAKGQGSFIKILSLAAGLTIGLALIAKVLLEYNFDACIKEKENVYTIHECLQREGEEPNEYGATPGGIVPKMREYIPEIVSGTRYTGQFDNETLVLEDERKVVSEFAIVTDTCFFDIFNSAVLSGSPRTILATPGQCMISKSLSETLGEDAVGKTFVFQSHPDKQMTIGGVFDDFDENTTMAKLDVIISLPSLGFFSWDGTANLIGNDRYHSYVRLLADADMQKVKEELNKMMEECIPLDDLRASGYPSFDYKLVPVVGAHLQDTGVKATCIILLVVALVMLFTAVMNYILVVISSLVSRARQMAVRRSIGAPASEFYVNTIGEAAAHLAIALLLMALVLFIGQNEIKDLLGVSLGTLFSEQTTLVIIAVCLIVLLTCGLLPAYVYSHIPLVYAYRKFSENRKVWKLSLLAFQLVLSAMLLSILVVVSHQYDYLLNKDLGYDYKDVAYIRINFQSDEPYSLAREIEKLPCVESATCAYSLFCSPQSGDNARIPDNPRDLFNCANLFFAGSSLVETMGLELVEGEGFSTLNHSGWKEEMLVDEKFAQKIKEVAGWDDVIGQYVINATVGPEYPVKIVGVVKNFTIGSLVMPDTRPMMVINGNVLANHILVRFDHLIPENVMKVQELCDSMYPDRDFLVKPYANELASGYTETLRTRNLITIGSIASLLIMLIGLIGYVRNEVQRRSKELAIRKVLGANLIELQGLFVRSITMIALPSILTGTCLGYYLSTILMEQFPDKIALSLWMFVVSALSVLFLTLIVILIQTYKVALANPVESIRTE